MAVDTELIWNGDKIINNVNSGTVKALIRATNLVQSTAKTLVRVDTGNLRGSITKNVDSSSLIGTVSTNSEYALAQEFGRKDLPKYGFTPYMRPGLNDNKKNIEKIFIDEERKAIDK